jgi:hypothetical protein
MSFMSMTSMHTIIDAITFVEPYETEQHTPGSFDISQATFRCKWSSNLASPHLLMRIPSTASLVANV